MPASYPPEQTGQRAGELYASHSLTQAARALIAVHAQRNRAWRGGAQLHVLRRGDRNMVFRAVAADGSGAAPTLIVKIAVGDPALAESDVRCMQSLTGTGVVPDVVLESEVQRGYLVTDAGDDTLQRVLEEGTAGDVTDAVHRMARVYARLHVEGRSLVGKTEALRESELTRELVPWMDGIEHALSWLRLDAGDARCRRALARITSAWYASRRILTLTHGDPAPSNVLLTPDGEARLVDFEYGSPRHPSYDLSVWDSLCPLPLELVDAHLETYAAARAELGWPVDESEASDYASLVAYRALAMLSWLPQSARSTDESWVETWSVRHAVIAVLERLAVRGAVDADIAPLAERAQENAQRWRARWPEVGEALPSWPALRGELREAAS